MTSDSSPANRITTPEKTVIAATMLVSWVAIPCNDPLAHAVPAEDLLGEHRAGEQPGDAVSEQRRHRDQRGAQPVFEQRAATGQALRPGGADEILAEHVQHGVALIPAVARDRRERQRERRQHQVLQPIDELVPGPTDRVRRGLAGVLEQLNPEHRVDPQRRKDQKVGDHEYRAC